MTLDTQTTEIQVSPGSTKKLINQIRRNTKKRFSADDKIRIVLEGFRKEIPVSDLCRREGVSTSIYYRWLKDFMEAGKSQLKRDSLRDATKNEVKKIKQENTRLKELLGNQALDNYILKKSLNL